MDIEPIEIQKTTMLSSYGLVTAERILDRLHIKVAPDLVKQALEHQQSFYYLILKIPLKNVMNGIVIQQANDYYVYLQKLFIDYLLSPEAGRGPEEQGANTREQLEEERRKLEVMNEAFQKLVLDHNNFISMTQSILLTISGEWKDVHNELLKDLKKNAKQLSLTAKEEVLELVIARICALCDLKKTREGDATEMLEVMKTALADEKASELFSCFENMLEFMINFEECIDAFTEQVETLNRLACVHRQEFYDTILRIIDLLQLLPEYRIDPLKDQLNKESLYFDNTIGLITGISD